MCRPSRRRSPPRCGTCIDCHCDRFWHDNQRRIAEVEDLERKTRRRDAVDEEALFAFYDERVGADVASTRHFDGWWKKTSRKHPHLLDLPREVLFDDDVEAVAGAFPDRWRQGELMLRLSYRFDPGSGTDGVTVHVPLAVLNRLRPDGFDWQVPGLREELLIELLRSLPKDLRRQLVPVPDTARAVLGRIAPSDGSLLDALERDLLRNAGVRVPRHAWRPEQLPRHLRMTFRVEGDDGGALGEGPDLTALQRELAPRLQDTLTRAAGIERRGLTAWSFGDLPRTFAERRNGQTVEGFPALVDEGDSVAIRVLPSRGDQHVAMWAGTRRLLLLNAGSPVAQVHRRLDNATKLALTTNPHGSLSALLDDAFTCAMDELLRRHGGPVWDAGAFVELLRAVRAELVDELSALLGRAAPILTAAAEVDARLDAIDVPALEPAVADMRTQLRGLVHPGFLTAKSALRLPDVGRYIDAMKRRLETLARDPARDRQRMERIAEVQRAYMEMLQVIPQERRRDREVREISWMIEELRVSEFAQTLGTAYSVSPERVLRAIDELTT